MDQNTSEYRIFDLVMVAEGHEVLRGELPPPLGGVSPLKISMTE